MFKNSHLRLLLTLCGFRRSGPAAEETPESPWILPIEVKADELKDALHFINQAEFSPPTFEEGVLAEHQLKRKTVPRKKAVFDDDDGDEEIDDIEFDFPVGGPTARKVIDEGEKPKKARKRRRKNSQAEELDEAALDEKAQKRREREREKARKVKSAMYVNEGDDEFDQDEDEAFYAREREIATRAAKAAQSTSEPLVPALKKRKARASLEVDSEEEGQEDDDTDSDKHDDDNDDTTSDDGVGDSETEDTSSGANKGESRKKRRLSVEDEENDAVSQEGRGGLEADIDMDDDAPRLEKSSAPKPGVLDEDEDADDAPIIMARRPRVRGGFIMESDDDD